MCEVNGRLLGHGSDEIKLLGRTIGRDSKGFYWEADEKHRDILLKEWVLESCKSVSAPASAAEKVAEGERPEMLVAEAGRLELLVPREIRCHSGFLRALSVDGASSTGG